MVWKSVSSTPPIFQVQEPNPIERFYYFFFYLNNPHYFFVITSGDSASLFNDPIEFLKSIFSVPLEIPRPEPHCLDFLWNSPIIW